MTLSQFKMGFPGLEVILGDTVDLDHPTVRTFYSELSIDYLAEISKTILADPRVREFPDVASFAFWIRASNLRSKKSLYLDRVSRRGLGLVVHIAPSNVPVNFAFSWAFGVLAGNSNLVRVPTKKFGQIQLILDSVKKVNGDARFFDIAKTSSFVRYERSLEISENLFNLADARVIWGGDESVRQLSKLSSKVGSRLLTFPDKYSIAVLSAAAILNSSPAEIEVLARKFVNDAFLFDQNACSSPRSVFWIGTVQDANLAMDLFWKAVQNKAKSEYELPPANLVRKFALACEMAATDETLASLLISSPNVFRMPIENDIKDLSLLHSRFGIFPEKTFSDLKSFLKVITEKCQTITYFGFQKQNFVQCLEELTYPGVDRVVPVGQALDMDMIWDGVDIPNALTRITDFK